MVEWSSVDAETLGIDLIVHTDDLREASPAETAFENFVGAEIPSQAEAGHLRAAGSDGVEQIGLAGARNRT